MPCGSSEPFARDNDPGGPVESLGSGALYLRRCCSTLQSYVFSRCRRVFSLPSFVFNSVPRNRKVWSMQHSSRPRIHPLSLDVLSPSVSSVWLVFVSVLLPFFRSLRSHERTLGGVFRSVHTPCMIGPLTGHKRKPWEDQSCSIPYFWSKQQPTFTA